MYIGFIDPLKVPVKKAELEAWLAARQWDGGSRDISVTDSKALQMAYQELKEKFTPMNGPDAPKILKELTLEEELHLAEYIIWDGIFYIDCSEPLSEELIDTAVTIGAKYKLFIYNPWHGKLKLCAPWITAKDNRVQQDKKQNKGEGASPNVGLIVIALLSLIFFLVKLFIG